MIIIANLLIILFTAILVNLPYDFVFMFAPKPKIYSPESLEWFMQFTKEQRESWEKNKIKNFLQFILVYFFIFYFIYFVIGKLGG